MRTNTKPLSIYTHEGAKACQINPELQLRRSIMSCLLFENTFYEDGELITDRITNLIPKVKPDVVNQMVLDARNKMYLRHIPLFIISIMAGLPEYKKHVKELLFQVIQRPDELTEFLALYWKQGKCPISNQIKKGLAAAFTKFNKYQLAKYNQQNTIKLRDVLHLCHSKPKDAYEKYTKIERKLEKEGKKEKHKLKPQELLYKNLINKQLEIPETWEVVLSAKTDESKKDKWERLLKENKLGGLALLRNLRNMEMEQVDKQLIIQAINYNEFRKVLPFRFIAAAAIVPHLEEYLEAAMLRCIAGKSKLLGMTILLVDVSGSMFGKISEKSDLERIDAGCGLAILLREISEQIEIYTFSDTIFSIPNRKGFALKDAIINSQHHMGTYLGEAINFIIKNSIYDRLIVITDEQSHDKIRAPKNKAYMINIATNKNGIGYGKWVHIDGWSEAVIDFIQEYEKEIKV